MDAASGAERDVDISLYVCRVAAGRNIRSKRCSRQVTRLVTDRLIDARLLSEVQGQPGGGQWLSPCAFSACFPRFSQFLERIYAVLKRRMAQRSANKPNVSILDIPIQQTRPFIRHGGTVLELFLRPWLRWSARDSIRQTSLFTRMSRKRL